jgi:adenylate cyclase
MAATRRLAAILAADVVGYSRLIGADEAGTLQRLRAIRVELIDPTVETHNGRIVKTTGDGLLIEFGSTVDALRCATEVQSAMAELNAAMAPDSRIEFRIGIHQGDIVAEDGDIFGDGVNIAARLEALAQPGGICVSARVQEDAAGKLDLAFRDLGEQRLHNIARAVRTYAIGVAARPRRLRRWWSWARESPALPTAQLPPIAGPAPASAKRPAPEAEPAPRLSIVVLPFANLSNDPEQEYFADGITDDLTTDLSRLPGSFVIARNTAFTYKGKPTDVKQIGRDLGVRYVVEGSVRRSGDQVQVNVQLIDTESGVHIWADRFDTDRRDLANAQAEITVRLANMLRVSLVAAEVARIEQRKAVDPDARDFVMRGRDWWGRPTSPTRTESSTGFRARPRYRPAVQRGPDRPGYGLGWDGEYRRRRVCFARYYARRAVGGRSHRARSEQLQGALGNGESSPRTKNRLREAQIEFETALALDRSNLDAVRRLGWAAFNLGEPEAYVPHGEKGLRLSPHDPTAWSFLAQLGVCHLVLNHVDVATDYLIKARATAPQNWWIPFYLAGALGLKGDLDGGEGGACRIAQAETGDGLDRPFS